MGKLVFGQTLKRQKIDKKRMALQLGKKFRVRAFSQKWSYLFPVPLFDRKQNQLAKCRVVLVRAIKKILIFFLKHFLSENFPGRSRQNFRFKANWVALIQQYLPQTGRIKGWTKKKQNPCNEKLNMDKKQPDRDIVRFQPGRYRKIRISKSIN